MQLYFTTVRRQAPLASGGSLLRLDWDAKQVTGSVPIVPRAPEVVDPNPRGSTRGGRGIARVGPHLVAGSYHTLLRFTPDLELVDGVSHGLLAGIHEVDVAPDVDALWVAATNLDAALLVRLGTGELLDQRWPRELPGLQAELGLQPLPMDKATDLRGAFLSDDALHEPGRVHLNAVRLHEGRLLGLLNKRGAIVDLDPRHGRGASCVAGGRARPGAHGRRLGHRQRHGRREGPHVRPRQRSPGADRDLRELPWVRTLEASVRGRSPVGRAVAKVLRRPVVSRPLFVRGSPVTTAGSSSGCRRRRSWSSTSGAAPSSAPTSTPRTSTNASMGSTSGPDAAGTKGQ